MAGLQEQSVLQVALSLTDLSKQTEDDNRPKSSQSGDGNRPIASRRTSRRAAKKYEEGTYMYWQKNKKERVLCKLHKTGTTRNLPQVRLHDGTIKHIQQSKLIAEQFPVGATVQCLDTKALDPLKRKFWYEAKVVRVEKGEGISDKK